MKHYVVDCPCRCHVGGLCKGACPCVCHQDGIRLDMRKWWSKEQVRQWRERFWGER